MSTKLRLYAVASVAAALSLTAGMVAMSTLGANAATGSFKDGPYASHSPDSGTCGNNWAVDLFSRQFKVTLPANNDGSYTVVETFANGRFITHGSGPAATTPATSTASPERCGATPTNGTLKEGISGALAGSFTITVAPGATFNTLGSCATDAEGECTTAAWINAFFGVGTSGYSVTKYSIAYNTSAALAPVAHHWVNSDTGDSGDIASGTSPAASPAHHGSRNISALL